MVGIDENDYSDIALTWMLEELVDDGDEVICLRVVDKDAKVVSNRNLDRKQYQEEAKELMERIQVRIDDNKAISIVLEFAVGKVTTTFQKMVSYALPCWKLCMEWLLISDPRFNYTSRQCWSLVHEGGAWEASKRS